jgi:hypothetical protein
MFEHYGHDAVCKELDEFVDKNGLSLFGMVCNVVDPVTHHFGITIFMYSKEQDALAKTFDDMLVAMEESPLLKTFDKKSGQYGESKWTHYKLENTTVSRKKYEVMFKQFY